MLKFRYRSGGPKLDLILFNPNETLQLDHLDFDDLFQKIYRLYNIVDFYLRQITKFSV